MTVNIKATLDTEQARLVALQGAATGYNRFLINAALDVIADMRQQPNESDADYGRRMIIAAQNAEPGTWAASFWPGFGTAVTVDTGTTVPAPSSGSASVSSIPTSLTGTGAIALTQATHAGKTLHAESGQTSLTIAAADWADGGECSVINHTGISLPITIGTGLTGFDNAKGGQSVVGPATVLVLEYLERAIIQVKDGQFVNVAKVGGAEREEGWTLSTYYRQGAIVRAPSASGTIGAGDRIIRNTAGTSAATFAADAANWTEIAEDPDSMPISTAALAVKGNATNATANATDIAAGTDDHVLRRSGTTLGFGTIATGGIADNAVSNAKLADMPANTAIVNNTASTADPVNLAIGTNTVLGRQAGNLVAAQVVTAQITTNAVDNTIIRDSAALSVIGRSANSTGDPADIATTANSAHILREAGGTIGWGLPAIPVLYARVVVTTNINIANDINNGDVQDGMTLATGDKVLLAGQSTASDNGLYVASAAGPASRAPEMDGTPAGEVVSGMLISISEGTANLDTLWQLSTNGTITVGTTALTFKKISAPAAADAAPVNVGSAAAIGTSVDYAREDHTHTIAADTVTNVMAANMAANTVKTNATATSADPSDFAIAANQVLGRNSTGNLTGLAVTDAALTVLDDATTTAMRATLEALNNSDSTDTTKKILLNVSGVDTATTRTLTIPNFNGFIEVREATPVSIQTANFTAAWGQDYVVSAASSSIVITLPLAAATNTGLPIRISREDDTTANVVRISVATGQSYSLLSASGTPETIDLAIGGTVEIISTGSAPYVRDRTGLKAIGSFWLPTNANVASIQGWYDAVGITGVSDGGAVTTWNDSSGNARNLGSGTGLVYRATGIGGMAAVEATVSTAKINATTQVVPDTMTMVCVFRNGASVVSDGRLFAGQTTGALGYRVGTASNGNYIHTGTLHMPAQNTAVNTVNTTFILSASYDDVATTSNVSYFRNGAADGVVSYAGDPIATAQLQLFNETSMTLANTNMRMSGFVLSNAVLSQSDREKIEGAMAWRYGSQAELVSPHPYKNVPPVLVLRSY